MYLSVEFQRSPGYAAVATSSQTFHHTGRVHDRTPCRPVPSPTICFVSVWICLLQTFHLNEACSVWPLCLTLPICHGTGTGLAAVGLRVPAPFVVMFVALFSRSKFWLAIPQLMDICVSFLAVANSAINVLG